MTTYFGIKFEYGVSGINMFPSTDFEDCYLTETVFSSNKVRRKIAKDRGIPVEEVFFMGVYDGNFKKRGA